MSHASGETLLHFAIWSRVDRRFPNREEKSRRWYNAVGRVVGSAATPLAILMAISPWLTG